MFISEKSYWITLIAVFTAFALLVWFFLFPYGIIDENLAANLFTSSIFMVLTVLLLSWLFSLREKSEWNNVKREVFSKIQDNAVSLFDGILANVEGGNEIRLKLIRNKINEIKNQKNHSNNLFFEELFRLRDTDEITSKPGIDSFLDNFEAFNVEFRPYSSRLERIESKYSKFLSSKVVESLIKIQDCVDGIESAIRLDIGFKRMAGWKKNRNLEQSSDVLPEDKELIDTYNYSESEEHNICIRALTQRFKDLMEEIYKICQEVQIFSNLQYRQKRILSTYLLLSIKVLRLNTL